MLKVFELFRYKNYFIISQFLLFSKSLIFKLIYNISIFLNFKNSFKYIFILFYIYLSILFNKYPKYVSKNNVRQKKKKIILFFFLNLDLYFFIIFFYKYLNVYLLLKETILLNFSKKKLIIKKNKHSISFKFNNLICNLGSLPVIFFFDRIFEFNITYIYLIQQLNLFCRFFFFNININFIKFLLRLIKLPLNN